MDTDRYKKTAEWFYSTVFGDEPIAAPVQQPTAAIPSPLRAARSLETGVGRTWQSRESIFLKQAKLLVNYEDDFDCQPGTPRYYPTYQSFTDKELRGYFSWRTKLRRGEVTKTALSFAFLYIYELLNQIGVESPEDGYHKLQSFADAYGALDSAVLVYLKNWMNDYVVYYNLDPSLLSQGDTAEFCHQMSILENVQSASAEDVVKAVKVTGSFALERSRFYNKYPEEFACVLTGVLRRIDDHHASRCKQTMMERFFGAYVRFPVHLFSAAVFVPGKHMEPLVYPVDEIRTYYRQKGTWSVQGYDNMSIPSTSLGTLTKSVDSAMRTAFDFRYPTKPGLQPKWVQKIIDEEIARVQVQQEAAKKAKITINPAALAKIRKDAAITRDKLIVDEEAEEEAPEPLPLPREIPPETALLDANQLRLLSCLLSGKDLNWVQESGLMLSVLVDSINEGLYDTFADSVIELDGTPQLVEDYIDELKEMVCP